MEVICRQQCRHNSQRNIFSSVETYHLNPILLISLKLELRLQNFHTMEGGTTQVITGAVKLAYNRGHYNCRQPGNQKCTCCTYATSRSHYTMTFQVEKLVSHYTAGDSSTTADIPRPTGKKTLCSHKILTML
jgi:hypothetical protein